MTYHRIIRRTPAALAAIAATVLVAACGSSDDKSSTASGSSKGFTLRLGFVTNSGKIDGPLGQAYTTGALQESLASAGVTHIKLIPFPNGPNVAAGIIGGAVDVGLLGDTPALVAGSHDVPAKLAAFTNVGQNAWLIARKGGPTTLDALKGKKVATAKGSYMDRYLSGLIDESGLTKDVKVASMLPPAGVNAIRSGALDAFAFPIPIGALLKSQGFPVVDEAAAHPELTGGGVALVADKASGAHPELVGAVQKAVLSAAAEARKAPQKYWAFQAQRNNVPPAIAKQAYPLTELPTEPLPAAALTKLKGTLSYLVKSKQATSFDIGSWTAKASTR